MVVVVRCVLLCCFVNTVWPLLVVGVVVCCWFVVVGVVVRCLLIVGRCWLLCVVVLLFREN